MSSCSGATGRMQKPFCTRSTKSQATERPPNSFSAFRLSIHPSSNPATGFGVREDVRVGDRGRGERAQGRCVAFRGGRHGSSSPGGPLRGSEEGDAYPVSIFSPPNPPPVTYAPHAPRRSIRDPRFSILAFRFLRFASAPPQNGAVQSVTPFRLSPLAPPERSPRSTG